MKIRKNARLRWALIPLFTGALFAGCSNSEDTSIPEFDGPASIDITPPASVLGCDDSLIVELTVTNLVLKPPYNCGTNSTCGSVQVSLLETADGMPLTSVRAATSTVQFDLTAFVLPPSADSPSLSQVHFIKAELLGDSLQPFPQSTGSRTSQTISVSLSAPTCSEDAGAAAGAGGAAGAAPGSAGQSSAGQGSAGAAGEAGATNGGNSNSGGSAGNATGGTAGSDSGGSAGTGGTGGTGGDSAGTTGSGGTTI
ncbi:MAG TPA: hypothetical protein VHV51_09205 [Polyangiaceae bacterium]|jgi:hypothetical protein|nr:hypothetical protein [Polyangiaceae bacterium]